MLAIKNATLIMKDHLIPGAVILCEDGKIVDFGKKLEIPALDRFGDKVKGLFKKEKNGQK